MNTTVGEGAFSGALLSGEKYEDEVISLADNFGPFKPLLESEGKIENLEVEHGTGNQIGGELAPHSKDGFEFIVGASLVDCTLPNMGVFDSVLLLDEMHEGKLVSVDSVFGSFESDMLLESQGVMDNNSEHKTGHPIQDKLVVCTEDEKSVRVATIHQGFRPFEPILLSGSEGDEDHHRIEELVQDKLTPRTEDYQGKEVATKPYYVGKVRNGKDIQIGNKHPTLKPKQERHQPYALPLHSKVTPSDYKMSYCELLRLGPLECKSRYNTQAQHISEAFGSTSSLSTQSISSNVQGSNRPPIGLQVLKPYNR
jgi:hypothetical protein